MRRLWGGIASAASLTCRAWIACVSVLTRDIWEAKGQEGGNASNSSTHFSPDMVNVWRGLVDGAVTPLREWKFFLRVQKMDPQCSPWRRGGIQWKRRFSEQGQPSIFLYRQQNWLRRKNTWRLMRVGSLLISINVKTKLAEALNIKISTNTFWTAIKWKVQVRRKNNICWFKLQVLYCDAKTLHVANLGAGQRSRKYNVTLPITEKHETHISQQWTLIIWPIHTHGLCWNLRVMLRVICRRELSSRWLVSYAWKHWNQLLGLWKFDTTDEARNQGEMYYWKSYHPWFLKIGIQYRMWSCRLN